MKPTVLFPSVVSWLTMLLCCLSANAQTQLQYWFDNDRTVSTVKIPASGTLKDNIDAHGLSQGLHTLYMRVRQVGATYEYSPVSMASFIKFAAAEGSALEYWFDNDVDNRSAKAIDVASGTEQTLMLDLSNIENFPLGVHQLNMRVAQNGGHYSAVYSATVLRVAVAEGTALEYWFDGDVDNRSTIDLDVASDTEQSLTLDLSNIVNFPLGVHQLNMRVAQNGGHYSAVYSATVLRLQGGGYSNLCYWLDDDYANRQRVTAISSNGNEAYFLSRLDLSSAKAGMHRLHYRVSSHSHDDGPVSEVPILVTRQYNNDIAEVKVVDQSYWMDDEQMSPLIGHTPLIPASMLDQVFTLNPSDYAVGEQHAFHVQYQNTAGVWSSENVTFFYKDASNTLRIGRLPTDDVQDAVTAVDNDEELLCYYRNGMVVVSCQSARLGTTGTIVVCDITGKILARKEADCTSGLHAELSVSSTGQQMLIVKVFSGDVNFTRKVMVKSS